MTIGITVDRASDATTSLEEPTRNRRVDALMLLESFSRPVRVNVAS